jgi:hypothetical protein
MHAEFDGAAECTFRVLSVGRLTPDSAEAHCAEAQAMNGRPPIHGIHWGLAAAEVDRAGVAVADAIWIRPYEFIGSRTTTGISRSVPAS